MPIPGLTNTYAFADWLKVEYKKAGRPQLLVTPENGGLLQIDLLPYDTLADLHPRAASAAREIVEKVMERTAGGVTHGTT